jgi:hypothetical protein
VKVSSVQLPGVNICAGLSLSSIPLLVLVSRGSPGSVGAIRIGPSSFPAGNVLGNFRCVLVELLPSKNRTKEARIVAEEPTNWPEDIANFSTSDASESF